MLAMHMANELLSVPVAAVTLALAAAYARAGRFPEAIATAEKALALIASPESPLGREIRGELELYRAGKRRPDSP